MGTVTILPIRIILALVLVGSLVVQGVLVAQLVVDPAEFDAGVAGRGGPILVIVVLGFAAVEVTAVCVWRLLSMARRRQVFSRAAFPCVRGAIGAIAAAALLVLALGVVLAPGEAVPPGAILMMGGLGLVILGVALIVLVLHRLLAQAIARDVEARRLRAELDLVI